MTKHAAGEAILTGMVSLGIHLILGAAVIAWLIRSNPQIFSRVPGGPAFSTLEVVYYVLGIASIALRARFRITRLSLFSSKRAAPA